MLEYGGILLLYSLRIGARGSVVGWGTMLQAGRSPVRVSDEVDIFNLPNPSSRIVTLGSTQPLTEMSTGNLPGGKSGWRVVLTILPPSMSRFSRENFGASTSRNPKGLHGLYRDKFTLPYLTYSLRIATTLWWAKLCAARVVHRMWPSGIWHFRLVTSRRCQEVSDSNCTVR
jgi:hypothetical protein